MTPDDTSVETDVHLCAQQMAGAHDAIFGHSSAHSL
eukprot:CAMPEP_0172710930 /NCGR_PEP_ID=MMETSP1074-20121228/57342_1 /TAXON_ID=2916 /ORGANISM="Ceratium fusus, Strain PA161109" /LENGTH=35 /DNA_ID= /DNA_START= /DNA_END= /DNA_ORIENTATION=